MSTHPHLRIVISNNRTPTFVPSSNPLAINSWSSPNVTLAQLYLEIEELLALKPSYVGGIAVLVRDQLERQRIEHPTAAREYAASLSVRKESKQ